MKQLPSPDADYKAPPGMDLSRENWDAAFGSVARRLRAMEGKAISYDDTVDRLTNQALALIGTNITTEIEARRKDLDDLETLADALQTRITTLLSGIEAGDVRVRPAIDGLTATTVRAAITEVLAKVTTNATGLANLETAFAKQRRITVASLFLGAS